MTFNIYEDDKLLFSGDCDEIKSKAAEGDELIKQDMDKMFDYYRCGDEVRVNVADIPKGSLADAEFTKNVFWLMKVMTDHGVMKKISPQVGMKIISTVLPAVAAVTKSHELALKRGKSCINFAQTVSEEYKCLQSGECSADEAVEKMIAALPPKNAAAEEYKKHPEFAKILNSILQLAGTCADPGYEAVIKDYISEIVK